MTSRHRKAEKREEGKSEGDRQPTWLMIKTRIGNKHADANPSHAVGGVAPWGLSEMWLAIIILVLALLGGRGGEEGRILQQKTDPDEGAQGEQV